MATTYTKLRDGSWGIRSTDKVRTGDAVTVRKQSGETKTETVDKILWTGDGVTLASIVRSNQPVISRQAKEYDRKYNQKSRYPKTGCSCGSREGYIQDSDCFTCKHDA